MNKEEFIKFLRTKLKRLDKESIDDIVNYYEELINDKIDTEHKTEEEIINEFGNLNTLIKNITLDRVASSDKKGIGAKILLGALLSPVLFPLFIVCTVLYIVLFAVYFSLTVSFGAVSIVMPFYGIISLFVMDTLAEKLMICGLSLIAFVILGIFAYVVAKYGYKLIKIITVSLAKGIRRKNK